jgi:uncharacterized NAD(P)/FAD-binding protein YdhS
VNGLSLTGADGLYNLLVRVRRQVKMAERLGFTAEPVVNALRPNVQDIWQGLSDREKHIFFHRLRPAWDAARHRIPPHVLERILKWKEKGRVVIHRGHLLHALETGGHLRVVFHDQDSGRARELKATTIINCTGPSSDLATAGLPFLSDALKKGLITQDPLRLGLQADPRSFEVIGPHGMPHPRIRALGPLLKGVLWETTAVREIRVQADALAAKIIDFLA